MQLIWPGLSVAEADAIYDFLALQLGWGRLRYTVAQGTVEGLWKCTALSRGRLSVHVNSLSATLEEVVL